MNKKTNEQKLINYVRKLSDEDLFIMQNLLRNELLLREQHGMEDVKCMQKKDVEGRHYGRPWVL